MKKIFIIMFTAVVFFMTAACGNVKYNALIYDNAQSEMKKEFLEANLTQNAYYGDGCYAGEACPKFIKHIVKDQETFDGIFAEAWIDIDFEKEMLVDALIKAGGNMLKAARDLKSSYRIVNYKVKKYGIDPHQFTFRNKG